MIDEKKGPKCNCLALLGVILIAVGLLADYIGLGKDPGIGQSQIILIIIGALILLFGLRTCKCLCNR